MDFSFLSSYVYVEVILLVISATEVLKKYTADWKKFSRIGNKWKALMVATFFFVIGYIYKATFFNDEIQVWKYLLSFAASLYLYDYLIKPIKDKINGKTPFVEEKPSV